MAPADSAETRTVARRMADEAANLYETGDYERACDLFHRANQLYPAPVLELWEARSLDKLGRLVEAEERYASVQRYKVKSEDTEVVRTAVREASIELENLRKRIPTITITLRGRNASDAGIEIHLDGKRLNPALIGYPIPVDAGARSVRLVVGGKEAERIALTLVEGDSKPVELDADLGAHQAAADRGSSRERISRGLAAHHIAQVPDRPRPWYVNPILGWVGVGVGAAGLAIGAATGLVASRKHTELSAHCIPNAVCPSEYADELDSFRAYRTASTLGYALGGLAFAGGASILIFGHEPKTGSQPSLALRLGGSKLSLVGRF